MAILKCKMCGGDMNIAADKTFGTCEYCGSVMTLPKVDDDQRAAAFNRGNHFRRIGEFDKALAVYERIVAEDDANAEAHWCCALCRFGIEYVEDPASYEWLPTCHRASFDSFLEDVDYLAALQHSDGITKRQYQKDAAKIAEVQRGILATSQNEEPFDVFLCYKESDENGERTKDSLLAQEIYYQLTEQGRRVFFSRITLEDKGGAEYEPYIFAALNSAKVMIAVGTKPEHFSAVWVKNEWSRFLSLMKKDHSKLLLPCYRDMDPYDLPEALSVLQSYDMAKIGFIQDLIRGVNKVLDAGKEKQQPVPAAPFTTQVVQTANANVDALIKRGNMALEDGEWKKADEFFDRALDLDAECAEGYLGKAFVEFKVVNLAGLEWKLDASRYSVGSEELQAGVPDAEAENKIVAAYALTYYLDERIIRDALQYSFQYTSPTSSWEKKRSEIESILNRSRDFLRAEKYAKGQLRDSILVAKSNIFDTFADRIAESKAADEAKVEAIMEGYALLLQELTTIKELHAQAEKHRDGDYQQAQSFFENRNYAEARGLYALCYASDTNYRDAKQMLAECDRLIAEQNAAQMAERKRQDEIRKREQAQQAAKKKKLAILAVVAIVVAIAIIILIKTVVYPWSQYKKADALAEEGKVGEAADIFEMLEAYKDAPQRIPPLRYMEAEAFVEQGRIPEAAIVFGKLGNINYKDSQKRSLELWKKTVTWKTSVNGGAYNGLVKIMSDGTVHNTVDNEYCDISDWTDIVALFGDDPTYRLAGLKSDGTVVSTGMFWDDDVYDPEVWHDIVLVAGGYNHMVGLRSDGTVVTTGRGADGALDVVTWTDIIDVAAGGYSKMVDGGSWDRTTFYHRDHTVGLRIDGTVIATGSNDMGQCDVEEWTDIVAIAASGRNTIGLRSDGTVVAVGYNEDSQCNVDDWTDIVAITLENWGDEDIFCAAGLRADGTIVTTSSNEVISAEYKDSFDWKYSIRKP